MHLFTGYYGRGIQPWSGKGHSYCKDIFRRSSARCFICGIQECFHIPALRKRVKQQQGAGLNNKIG